MQTYNQAAYGTQNPPGEQTPDTGQQTPAKSIDDLAKEQGWNPEYDGPDKIDAAEYVRRKPLFDKIKAQSRELKEVKKLVQGMADTYQSMSQAQYTKGIKDAEARMKAAETTFDVAAFKQAATDKAQLEQARATLPNAQSEPPEVTDFISRNSWFDKDKAMTADAIDYRDRFVKANPGAELAEVLEYVENRIKRDYPDKFKATDTRRATTPAVESGTTNHGSDPLAKLKASMSGEERRIMKMYIKPGGMTEAEYLTSYAQVRGEA